MNGTKFAFLILGIAILSISLISGITFYESTQGTTKVPFVYEATNTQQATAPAANTPIAPATATVASESPHVTAAPTGVVKNTPTVQVLPETHAPTTTPIPSIKPRIYSGTLGNHIVKSGETLYCIGRAYGVQPWAIAKFNDLPSDAKLSPGQTLKIPNSQWEIIPQGERCKQQFISPYSQIPANLDGLIFISYHDPTLNQAGKNENEPIGENRKITVVIPDHLQFGGSSEVKLAFSPENMTPNLSITPSDQPVHTQESAPIPINGDLFDKYLISAIARIDSAGFNIAPSSDMKQPVRKGKENIWVWSISPVEGERQNLIISLWLSYEPINSQQTAPRPNDSLWINSFDINVTDTLGMNKTQLATFTFFGTILGSISVLFSTWEKVAGVLFKNRTKTVKEPA
jgi:LysM repeat protein